MSSDASPARRGFFSRWLHRLWWLLNTSRRIVFNLIFLAIVVALVASWWRSAPPRLQDKTALVLSLKGSIVEQRSGGLRDRLTGQAQGTPSDQVQLRDVLAVLDAAAKDPHIDRVVLLPDELSGAGMVTLREVSAALDRVRASGKQVVAWASGYDQRQYYLAAHADEVYLDPMGAVMIEGFGRYRNYYKDALDRLGVTANVIRVGTFKNAAEPYFANGPSPASLEAEGTLWNGLWATYTADVEKARKLPAGSIAKGIDDAPARFAAAGGNSAQLALREKLVDGLKTRDELRQLLIERGVKDDAIKSFRQVSFDAYLSTIKPQTTGDSIGVVVAEGEIVDGDAAAGTIGGRSTAELIRKAREDSSIKAIVLRVNSPGGSAFGSELVRRELALTRAAGKPVVVSMGDVAASGGYWITMSS
ncbi:MAG: signal peptide peptidase SppA, partial [Betaproteobacteria bacterium]|nr:signal peptide peptidase SppA [Betaproteobacteria bacterium]